MALFLVQHGRSAAKDIDPRKGLTDLGREETKRMASVAKGYEIPVQKIVHSGKNRAEQTAVIYQEALAVKNPIEAISGINPLDDVQLFAATINPEDNLLVVGHLPFMERLVSFLTTGSPDTRVYRFQNSGIVCLDVQHETESNPDWFIKWTLNPTIP
jgi:phosphohistidine phosphatase